MSSVFRRTLILTFIICAFSIMLVGCASNPNSPLANQCEDGLSMAYDELNYAKTKGFSGTVEYTKAASLLMAAKVQFEFGKYPNCINKIESARAYIERSQR